MKKKLTTAALATSLICVGASNQTFGSEMEIEQIKNQVQQLSMQNQILLERISELEKSKAMTPEAVESADAEENDILSYINDHVTFSGAIEVETVWSEDFEGASESSVDLATAEFAFEAELTDWAMGVVAIEWDEDDDKLTVDEAFISLGGTEKFPTFLQGGRYVVPFGVYDGNTVTDPLTNEAFETKEDALTIGTSFGPVSIDAYLFNGETNEGDSEDSHLEQYGVALGYAYEDDTLAVEAHLGYSSSIIDADGLEEEFDLEADYVDGVAMQGSLRVAGAVFIAEYITALDDAKSTDEITGEISTAEPSAYQLEAGYNFNIGHLPLLFAVGYSGTSDLGGILPESRLAVVLGIELVEGLGFNLEYAHDTDYDQDEGGTGEKADSVIGQLYYEF